MSHPGGRGHILRAADRRLAHEGERGMPVLHVDKLSKNFGGLAAVRNLSFQVEAGEIRGIDRPQRPARRIAQPDQRLLPAERGRIPIAAGYLRAQDQPHRARRRADLQQTTLTGR
jgi:hypothetical protein